MSKSHQTDIVSLGDFRTQIDQVLRSICESTISEAEAIDPVYAQLLEVVRDLLLRSGKRLRPYLAYLAYRGSGGHADDSFMPVAASLELFHNFLLIHDDIMDRDLVRHGGLNVAGTYYDVFRRRHLSDPEAYHHAQSYALMAGNASCALGLAAITGSDFAAEPKLAALTKVNRMLFEEMGGQLTNVSVSIPGAQPATADQLLKIARYKTAAYSFITPLQVGAIFAGAPGPVGEQLLKFGESLGIAFQLADDLLGVYGDEATLGKPIYSDMREGKHTLLIHYAFELATPTQAKALRTVWGHTESGAPELETVKTVLHDAGAHQKVASMAESYLQSALATLVHAPLSGPAKAALDDIAQFSVRRNY